MATLNDIETTLRRWGVTVLAGDIVAGRPGAFAPTHVMVHHTASSPPRPAPSAGVVRKGRPGIAGPLCHLLVRRDLKVELVSRGKANHAGLGGPWGDIPRDNGNTRCLGIEIEHAGTKAEDWTPEMMAFCRTVEAACLDHLGQPASHLLAHKEWAPTRKIDPYDWDMRSERAYVAGRLAAGPGVLRPPTDLLEEIMALDRNSADYKLFVADIAAAVASTQRPLMNYVDALYDDADGKMSLEQAAQHGAGQSFAANQSAGRAAESAARIEARLDAVDEALADIRKALPPAAG